jgi:RES domain-containing protein
LATPEDACVAEFMRLAKGQAKGAQSFLPRDLHEITVVDLELLDLTSEGARKTVAITLSDIERADRGRCQSIGEAAQFVGLQGVLAPSATGVGLVLAVYERQVRRGQLTVLETRPLASILTNEADV